MEWTDDAILLSARGHGETDAIATVLTFQHGRHLGLVRGGAGRRARPVLQSGNRVQAAWRARLPEHLGQLTLEPVRLFAALMLEDPLRLAATASACVVIETSLGERDPHPELFAALLTLLNRLCPEGAHWAAGDPAAPWLADYVRFELLVLDALGFGLALDSCAVTGATADLAFVSPRTGRAVSREAAGEFAPRLLALPPFLRGGGVDAQGIADGLRLAGHFLRRHIWEVADRPVPLARDRLVGLWQEQTGEKPA